MRAPAGYREWGGSAAGLSVTELKSDKDGLLPVFYAPEGYAALRLPDGPRRRVRLIPYSLPGEGCGAVASVNGEIGTVVLSASASDMSGLETAVQWAMQAELRHIDAAISSRAAPYPGQATVTADTTKPAPVTRDVGATVQRHVRHRRDRRVGTQGLTPG